MNDFEIWERGGRPLLVAGLGDAVPLVAAMPPSGSAVVARLCGDKLREADDVFAQFAEMLQFPAYFGWNWNALSDCLEDLSWYPADRYLIIIEQAEKMLYGSVEDREIFLSILVRAANSWANPLGKTGGNGVFFKVLLLAEAGSVETLRADVLRHH